MQEISESPNHTRCPGEFVYRGIVWNRYTSPEIVRRCGDFRFRPTDVCVCSFPRSGTTLTQEIIWEIINRERIAKDEKFADIDERFPFLEYNPRWEGDDSKLPLPIDLLEDSPLDAERLIKTHCPYSFIKQNLNNAAPKVIVVARNPKDCCSSMYNFYKGMPMFGPWQGDWPEFFELFLTGRTKCGDYFQSVAEWWQQRNRSNLLFLKYEDIVRQPKRSIRLIADFLGHRLTGEQLEIIAHNCHFDAMFSNENINFKTPYNFTFIRKGVIGDWKSQMTVAQSEAIDAAVREKFDPIDLQFDYE